MAALAKPDPARAAGSDVLTPVTSREARSGGVPETAPSGRATGNTFTHVQPIAGGELHVSEAGSRVAVQIRTGRGLRDRLTASMALDDAELWFQRGLEIAQHARAQRQAKGA